MAARGKQGAQSKYDHLIKLLLIGDSGAWPWVCRGWIEGPDDPGLCVCVRPSLHPVTNIHSWYMTY